MSIISPADFVGNYTIAQRDTPAVSENLQWFINEYENKFLRALLGVNFANEFITGLAADPIEAKWTNIVNNTDLKSMITAYVYYWFQRNQATKTMGISEGKPKAENATPVSPAFKMASAWNGMVDKAREFNLDVTIYPDYVKQFRYGAHKYNGYWWYNGFVVSEIFYYINDSNI